MTLEKQIADRIRACYARAGQAIPYTINEALTDEEHGRSRGDWDNGGDLGITPTFWTISKKIQDEMIVDGKLTPEG